MMLCVYRISTYLTDEQPKQRIGEAQGINLIYVAVAESETAWPDGIDQYCQLLWAVVRPITVK